MDTLDKTVPSIVKPIAKFANGVTAIAQNAWMGYMEVIVAYHVDNVTNAEKTQDIVSQFATLDTKGLCARQFPSHIVLLKGTMVLEPSGVNAGTVVAIVVSLLVVTALVVVILYFIRRRRQKASEGEKHDDMGLQRMDKDKLNRNNDIGNVDEIVYTIAEDDSDVEHAVQTQTEHGSVIYANTGDQVDDTTEITYHTVGIAVANLKAVVKTKMDNKAKALEDEYMALPSGNLHAHNVGKKTENKGKNRYKTTFPYDHSRVVLEKVDDDEHSDYINANYIHSVISPAQYIATQGPLEKTVDDFWRMIWQQESSKIVMLTNLIEGSKKKCAKYWPDEGEPLTTKHFSVVLDRERVYAFYAIRDINVTEKKTYSVRQVQHFHFTTWPDHGIPDSNELVVFHRRVMQQNTGKGKMVVHCSAGIGRTGTFIALDALLNYGREFGTIDVMEYIVTMRKDRINMVQTSSQYIALHHILTEAFDMPDTLISRLKYHTALDSMRSDTAENQTKIRREYQLTQVMKPTYDARDYQTAMLPVNRQKNRNSDVLAVDRFRAYLTTSTRNRTDYINAVRVPSYLSRTGFIVTQTPLEDTVVDLLTMLIDYQCDTLVIIEKDRVDWLPEEDGDKTIGAFTLKRKGGSPRQSNTEFIDVSISNQDTSYNAEIRVFHVSDWNRELSVPPHSRSILLLLELLDRRRQGNALKTTVVMCRDGCTQCGLFCCISNAREQMNIDDEVDIFQVSRQLLIRRPEFIISFDQYQSCYNMIKDYLDTIEIYIN
ncbi:receptor-type tyrosine-protein phosphatase kappa-like [Ylistrum balloti]|uniref:receptor-type tyrosine-protein phosphatase kappa-like n=1 Tax=Ylistrum balloti TaxID=509963 RepID=UPI0029058070|nr:receptor-type tyrosine-protein phosphatase kappa-like [Ylistrum balloti]